MNNATYAVGHFIIGAAFVFYTVLLWPWSAAFVWMALAFCFMAGAYAADSPRMLAKRANGSRSRVATVLLGPYLAYVHVVWLLVTRFDKRRPVVELVPGLFIGRRVRSREVPSAVCSVMDLTAELLDDGAIREHLEYVCVPMLDAGPPGFGELDTCAEAFDSLSSPVLVHCAQGNGRTSLVAAALLLVAGHFDTVESALDRIEMVRPGAHPNELQRQKLVEWWRFRMLSLEG